MSRRNYFNILWKCLRDKDYRFITLAKLGIFNSLSDEEYLKRLYKGYIKKELHLDNPKTFNEKLQWLKIYDRKKIYTTMVDKYDVKKYVAEKIGEQYIIPTLGVWERFEDIDFDKLPDKFVLKCTHDSGGVVICEDIHSWNKGRAKRKLNKSLRNNYYWFGREWPYKEVQPRIIAEQYIATETEEMMDYKLMCFNGVHKCSFVCSERYSGSGLKVTFYDKEWAVMPFERHYPKSEMSCKKPKCYDEMVRLAEKLSQDIPFLRVDFYEVGGKLYFGELTFYPGAGLEEFQPETWDETLGSWINLPKRNR